MNNKLVEIDEPGKKELILKASLDLFSKKGVSKTTIRDIASRAKVSIGLIYFYFKNKDDILKDIFLRIRGNFPEEGFDEFPKMQAEAIFEKLCSSHFKFMTKNFKQFFMFLTESNHNNMLSDLLYSQGMLDGRRDLEKIMNDLQQRGEFRNFNAHTATLVFFNAVFMFVLLKEGSFKKQLKDQTTEEYSNVLIDILLNGMKA